VSKPSDSRSDLDQARRRGVRRTVGITLALSLGLFLVFFLQHV
jgi:hypothetical protein